MLLLKAGLFWKPTLGTGAGNSLRELGEKFVSLLEGTSPQIPWMLGSEAQTCLELWPRVGFLDALPESGLTSALVSCDIEGCQSQALS